MSKRATWNWNTKLHNPKCSKRWHEEAWFSHVLLLLQMVLISCTIRHTITRKYVCDDYARFETQTIYFVRPYVLTSFDATSLSKIEAILRRERWKFDAKPKKKKELQRRNRKSFTLRLLFGNVYNLAYFCGDGWWGRVVGVFGRGGVLTWHQRVRVSQYF